MSDPLLTPFTLKNLTLKNRIISTPHAPAYAEHGMPAKRYQLYHEEKAKGGIGMTMFGGSSSIASDSPPVFGQLDVSSDRVIPYFQEFAHRIHQHDCGLICQISHLGRRTVWNNGDWLPVIGPSRVRETAHRAFPKEMDQHDIDRVINQYALAAWRCQEGGLDGCEILVHGHLPGQFLTSFTNNRNDEYGGSLQNRLRFTLELLSAVRKQVDESFIIGIRIEMTTTGIKGTDEEEFLQAAQLLEQSGLIDYLSLNFGRIDSDYHLSRMLPAMWSPLAPWVSLAGKFRQSLKLPVLHACKVADLSSARYAIENGLLDLVGMTRAHMADPYIVNKLESGMPETIRPCVGAGYCIDRIYGEGEALCLHNVATGREATLPHVIKPAEGPRKTICIVGAGPAGLEAARVGALRGHTIILFEASNAAGGQLRVAAKATWRKDLVGIVDWYVSELERLAVDIRYNVFAGSEEILSVNPDIVIVATGGVPDTDFVPGGEHAISVWDALDGAKLSGDILIYDDHGQHQAVSCADHLSEQADVSVELVTPDRHAAAEMGGVNYPEYMRRFHEKGVTVTPDYRLSGIERQGNRLTLEFKSEYTGSRITRTADHAIVEHGTLPADELYYELAPSSVNDGQLDYQSLTTGFSQTEAAKTVAESGPTDVQVETGFHLYRVGDAIACRNVHAAILDSLRLVKDL